MLKREGPVPTPLVLEIGFPNRPKPGVCAGAPVRVELSLGVRLEEGLWPKPLNRPPLCGAEDGVACDDCIAVELPKAAPLLVDTAKTVCAEGSEGCTELDCPAKMEGGCAGSFGTDDPRLGVPGAGDDLVFKTHT